MIISRQLASLLFAVALGSNPLFAQPATQQTAPQQTGGEADEAAKQAPPKQQAPAAAEPAQQSTGAGQRKESPADYRPSEEISEDVPVSFPVDI